MKLTKEQNDFVKSILEIPSKELTDIAIGYVNLSDFEKEVIEMNCFQQLSYSKICDKISERDDVVYDIKTIQRAKRSAFIKMYDVWSHNYLISKVMG